jgi:hypothetical protein
VRDIFAEPGTIFEKPVISKLFEVEFPSTTFLRVKWNISGTCFSASNEDGNVMIWQRNANNQFSEIAKLSNK